jgi:hypothetical protein
LDFNAAGGATTLHDDLGYWHDGLEYGYAIPGSELNVQYMNSLQVWYSERFLIASAPDFGMVEEMCSESPNLRHGPRPIIQ